MSDPTKQFTKEYFQDKDLIPIDCKCGQHGLIAIDHNNYQTACLSCHVKYFQFFCPKCESGYLFPETDSKEISLKKKSWFCSVCKTNNQIDFNKLTNTNWINKSEIPSDVYRQETRNLLSFPAMKAFFLLMFLAIAISSLYEYLTDKTNKEWLTTPSTTTTYHTGWTADFIDGLKLQYPADFIFNSRGSDIIEANNNRFGLKVMRKTMGKDVLDKITVIKGEKQGDPTLPGSKITAIGKYFAYTYTQMSSEGIFMSLSYIPVGDNNYYELAVSADTRLPVNSDLESHGEIIPFTTEVLRTFDIK